MSSSRSDAPSSASATVLLLVCGALLAVVILCAKSALGSGLSVLDFAGVSSAAAAALLLSTRWRALNAAPRRGGWWALCGAMALASLVLPNVLQAAIAIEVGAGYAAMMLALSPMWTLAIGIALGTERLRWRLALGLLLGLVGVLVLTASRWSGPAGGWNGWALLGGLIPVGTATGNHLRACLMRDVADGRTIATAVLALAAVLLSVAAGLDGHPMRWTSHVLVPLTIAALATAAFNVLLFRLQQVGGAVRLSQVGYVAAAVGAVAAALLFGEPLTPSMLVAGLLIAGGIRLVGAPPAKPPAPTSSTA